MTADSNHICRLASGGAALLERIKFLKEAENRESFFRRISRFFPSHDPRYKLIEKAYNTAKDAFRGVEREGGDRYFEHLRAVALILIDYLHVRDANIIAAALLHDIVEDIASWPIERVDLEFGEEIALMVEWVTKPPEAGFSSKEERNRMYDERLMQAPRDAILIKLADRLHNVITLWSCPPEKRARKIDETRMYYLPLAEKHWILYYELEEALENVSNIE